MSLKTLSSENSKELSRYNATTSPGRDVAMSPRLSHSTLDVDLVDCLRESVPCRRSLDGRIDVARGRSRRDSAIAHFTRDALRDALLSRRENGERNCAKNFAVLKSTSTTKCCDLRFNDNSSVEKDSVLLFTRCTIGLLTVLTWCLKLVIRRCSSSTKIEMALLAFISIGLSSGVAGFANDFDRSSSKLVDKLNLDQIGAVFNKVAYGSTTKRSIPDNAYPVTTLTTPLLTTFRYSDGNDEWMRVDVKNAEGGAGESGRSNLGFDGSDLEERRESENNYGSDLEKDHALPTSAPAADILKNNNNKHYSNPNRYNNDRLRPEYEATNPEQVTENAYKTTTSYNLLKNVRPTKSMHASREYPGYIPPDRGGLFTPSLPPHLQNPFADNPTIRGTHTDYAHKRPLPPPSLTPSKDRVPYRPDLPKVNTEKSTEKSPNNNNNNNNNGESPKNHGLHPNYEKKKTLNTPSQSVRIGEVYGASRNDTNFEYNNKDYIPAITRILSGSDGHRDEFPDLLYQSVTATPNLQRAEPKVTKTRAPSAEPSLKMQEPEVKTVIKSEDVEKPNESRSEDAEDVKKELIVPVIDSGPPDRSESVTIKKSRNDDGKRTKDDATTQINDMNINLANTKEKSNVTKATSDEMWLICWNVHIYLVVIFYFLLACFSIFKLVRYENDPHMFTKSYFLTIHLMLTVICVLRIFYLSYDPYNVNQSFNVLLYDFLHSFPLSLLATTFAVLILFLLKRTLTHLEVKTRPVFLVVFAFLHIVLCFVLSIVETLGQMDKASLIVCKPVFVLLSCSLGASYLYLYRIIKKVLARRSDNLSEMCSQNISYASHITIAVALLFVLLGVVQLYGLFCIKEDRFNGEFKPHWLLWGFELSIRVIEISIMTLLAIVVSLKMSQREKQSAGGFPLFPCTTSDSSTDNIYPNNCNTNPNALNYSRQEMNLDNLPTAPIERPNLLKNAFQNDSFDKKSTLERYHSDNERPPAPGNFDRFERPKWGSDRFETRQNSGGGDQNSLNNFVHANSTNFERGIAINTSRNERNSARKPYDSAKYYAKPKYEVDDEYQHDMFANHNDRNIYSEPIDNHGSSNAQQQQQPQQQHQYERTRHEFERGEFDRRSRNSNSNTSGRRSTGRARKNHARPHLGVQTLPGGHDAARHQIVVGGDGDSMLVDEQGFVRFRHMQEEHERASIDNRPKKTKKDHYGEA